jgi:hypothetical protein
MRPVFRPLLASLTLVLAACGGGTDSSPIKTTSSGQTQVSPAADSVASRGHSLVRVVNAVSTDKSVNVQLGDRTLFAEVRAGGVTDYAEVETNLAQFSVLAAGSTGGTMLAQTDRILLDGNRYTIFVISQDVSQQALRVVRDDVIPDSGKARLRLIHAAPGGPEFDVQPTGSTEKIFSGVDFLGEAGPADLSPVASLALELRAAGEPRLLMKMPAVELRRGTTTTVVVTGSSKLGSFKFTDAMMKQTPAP